MRQTKFYKSLRFKISIGLVGQLSFTMSVLFIIQYVQHREKMIRNLQENISPHLTQMVNDVLKSSMLSSPPGRYEPFRWEGMATTATSYQIWLEAGAFSQKGVQPFFN